MPDQLGSISERFEAGSTFSDLMGRAKDNAEMWQSVYKRAAVSDEALKRVATLHHTWHLLVINEDWCGDSVNILPYVARLEESSTHLEMRIIGREANRDLMDLHLTRGARSIPVVIVYDAEFNERGCWGPRPKPLQDWVIAEGLALPKPDRYRHIRSWYARDRGATIVSEILSIIEGVDG